MSPTSHLKDMFQDGYDAKLRNTPAGMAHLAGTGPAGTTCKTCAELSPSKGKPNTGGCERYWRAFPRWGGPEHARHKVMPRFNVNTPSCKWWQAA